LSIQKSSIFFPVSLKLSLIINIMISLLYIINGKMIQFIPVEYSDFISRKVNFIRIKCSLV
jgi:hypothetical protein